MTANLNSAILNLAMLDSAILVFPLKLTHTCQDWFPPFPQKNFTHSFWLNLMMAAILNSVMLDWDTAILDSDTLLSSLRFTQKHWLWLKLILWFKLIHSHSNLMMAAILNSAILIWPSDILKSHSHLPRLVPTISTKKHFTHSFWLNLMMAAILNSAMLDSDTAILDSDTLLSSLRFTQKHSHSTLTLTQTNSIWLKLIHSHLTWMTAILILPWAMLDSAIILFPLKVTQLAKIGSFHKKNFIHSFWLNLMMAAILNSVMLDSLPSWIQTPCHLTQTNSIWLKLIHSHLNLILESWHVEFGSQTQSHLPRLVPTISTKKTSLLTQLHDCSHLTPIQTPWSSLRTQKHSHSTLNQTNSIWLKLIHSHLTWWWQPSWILPSWIWLCWIQPS